MTLLSGTVSTTGSSTATLAGTASADVSGVTALLSGTATVDFSTVGPWLAPDRRTRVRVVLDGEDLDGLVGRVTIDEQDDAISRIATFQVLDPRAAFWHARSITRGGRRVQIYGMCDDLTDTSEALEFDGYTDAAPNEGAYCPLATVRCLSLAGTLLQATNGCVNYAAFSGVRRRDILIAYAASCGVALTLDDGLFMTVVQKDVSISGVSIEALILRFCEVEGYYARELIGGTLEFVPWEDVGPDAPPYVAITEDMYVGSPREEPPNRPVTVVTVGGSGITQVRRGPESPATTVDVDITGVDSNGDPYRTVITTTRRYGVELETVREDFRVYALKGVTPGDARYRLVKRQTTTTDYVLGRVYGTPSDIDPAGSGWDVEWDPVTSTWLYYFNVPTAQVLKVTDVTEGWGAPRAQVGAAEHWSDNTYHPSPYTAEAFLELSRAVTTFAYDADTCRLTKQTVATQGWYTQKAAGGGAYLYDDGSYRAATAELYQDFSLVVDDYIDNLATVEAGTQSTRINTHTATKIGWVTTSWGTAGGAPAPIETFAIAEQKIEIVSGTVGQGSHSETTITNVTNGESSVERKTNVAGAVPDPQVASDTTPQYTKTAIKATFSAWTDIYPVTPAQEPNDDAETEIECDRVARRRTRKNLAVRQTITAPAIVGLRALHSMTLDDSARTLDAAAAHVEHLTHKYDSLNGWMGMTLTLAQDPAGV